MSFGGEISQTDLEIELRPYIVNGTHIPEEMYGNLAQYLQLLMKWNAHTNLTAIREPREIVRRHFGESLFAAQHLGECETLLDFGSGAGFPGLPIQLLRPDIRVTVAESQNKKATFLREVIRTLDLKTNVWAKRVEAMSKPTQFDVVTLRAVDNMGAAIEAASQRTRKQMMLLTTVRVTIPEMEGFAAAQGIPIPDGRDQQLLSLFRSK